MERGRFCPVCLKVWVWGPEGPPETCPNCSGVLLLAVVKWEGDRTWSR